MIARLRKALWRIRGLWFYAPGSLTLVLVCLTVLLLQQRAARVEFVYGYTFNQVLTPCFGLTWSLLKRGFLWQPLTYMFLHAGWLHLMLNMLTVILLGSGLEREVGTRNFWRVFISGGITGGLGWLVATALLAWAPLTFLPAARSLESSLCIGASGGVFALIGAYTAIFPQREMVVFLLILPLRMKARTLAWLLGLITIGEALWFNSQIAYAAHLAGGMTGYIYGKILLSRTFGLGDYRSKR